MSCAVECKMSLETESDCSTSKTAPASVTAKQCESVNSTRTKDSYNVRFFDGKAPGTADDGKIKKDPHPHNQNWGRTGFLLMEGGTIILRLLLEEKVKQISNGNLVAYLKLPANYQTLFDLYHGKVISPLQWDVLYPNTNPQSLSLLELDIIMLYILVIHTCQFKGDILMDIQKLEKRRDCLYEYTKDVRIADSKFEQEYEAVGAVLVELIVSRGFGRDVDSRIKNMVKSLKNINMTKEEIVIYLDVLKRWYLSDIDIRKAIKELKPLLKNGQGEHRKAKDILAKLKMISEDDNTTSSDIKDIKDELEKLAGEIEGIKKKKTKLKTVNNILSILTPRFSQPFNMESVGCSIPSVHRWEHSGVQFVLSFYCQGQLHVYTKSTKLVVEAKIKILLEDERLPQGEVATVKALESSKFRDQLSNDLHLNGVGTLTFKERSFFIVPIESSEQGYRKLMDTVKLPVWKTTISNVFETEEVKGQLKKGGCLCMSANGDPTVMVDIRCRGSDIPLSTPSGSAITARTPPFNWKIGTRTFVVKKYFLGKGEEGSATQGIKCILVDLTLKKGKKIDTVMETKLSQQLIDDKFDLSTLLHHKDGVSSVKCEQGKPSISIAFNTLASVKAFHDRFRYSDVQTFVKKIFDLPKVVKVIGSAGYNVYVDLIFSMPEVECEGLPEPAAPGTPNDFKIVDVAITSVLLSWEPPMTDGGIEIISYHIERNDVGEKKWVKVGVVDCTDTKYHVTNLQTSHEYYFRIKAENLAGFSPFAETPESVLLSRTKASKPSNITIKDKRSKPTPKPQPKMESSSLQCNDRELKECEIEEIGQPSGIKNTTEESNRILQIPKEKTFAIELGSNDTSAESKNVDVNRTALDQGNRNGDSHDKLQRQRTSSRKRDGSFKRGFLLLRDPRARTHVNKKSTEIKKGDFKRRDWSKQQYENTSDDIVANSEAIVEPDSAVSYYTSEKDMTIKHDDDVDNNTSDSKSTQTSARPKTVPVTGKKENKRSKSKNAKSARRPRRKTPVFM